jgi:hypothetical protein
LITAVTFELVQGFGAFLMLSKVINDFVESGIFIKGDRKKF